MLPEKLSELRKKKGLSQIELAETLNVSRQAVSRWETGEAAPSLENLKCLRDLYNVSLDYLVCDGEEPVRSEPEPEAVEIVKAELPRPRRAIWAFVFAVTALAISVAALLLTLMPRLAAAGEPKVLFDPIPGQNDLVADNSPSAKDEHLLITRGALFADAEAVLRG